jgi:hypothetical protein
MDRGAALNCRVVHNWTENSDNAAPVSESEDVDSDDADSEDAEAADEAS